MSSGDAMIHAIFLLSVLLSFPELNRKFRLSTFAFVIICLFLALRYDYGNDYMSYYHIHKDIIAGYHAWGETDILFKYLNLTIRNFYIMVALISILNIMTIKYLMHRYLRVDQYWFSMLLFVINPYLILTPASAIRQSLAICFFIYASLFAMKREIFPFLLCVAVAVGMHASAIVLFPVYFVLNERKLGKVARIIIFGFLLMLVLSPIFSVISTGVLKYLPMQYTRAMDQGESNSIRSTVISFFFFVFMLANINKLEGRNIVFGKLYLIGTIISIMAIRVSMITRVGMYFNIFAIVAIPMIFDKIRSIYNRQFLFSIILLIYILRYLSFFSNPLWVSFAHYKTVLGQLLF